MGVSIREHRRNEEILEEAKMEPIVIAIERKWQWFWHMKIRKEIENVGAVAKMKMDRGRPRLRWKDTVRKNTNVWKIENDWATCMAKLKDKFSW